MFLYKIINLILLTNVILVINIGLVFHKDVNLSLTSDLRESKPNLNSYFIKI